MLQSPLDDIIDRIADLVPRGMKGLGRLFPGEFACPTGQKQHVGFGQLVLALTPRNLFHHDAATWAVHASHAVQKENQNTPERNELKAPHGKSVVTGSWLVAAGADSRRAPARPDHNFKGGLILNEAGALVDESPGAVRPLAERPQNKTTCGGTSCDRCSSGGAAEETGIWRHSRIRHGVGEDQEK